MAKNHNPLIQTLCGKRRRFRVAQGWLQKAPPCYIIATHNPNGTTLLEAVPGNPATGTSGFERVSRHNVTLYGAPAPSRSSSLLWISAIAALFLLAK